jgi:uncharacterized protein YbaP (TraB family)
MCGILKKDKMKKILAIIFISISLIGFSQETYKGLLWEISGNGLTKKSYLYGTMHVSGRIAYHLGEEFFEGLEQADAIALESNPIIWLDEIVDSKYANDYLGRYAIKYQYYKGFYKDAFKVNPPESKELSNALSSNHYLTNWMLYRESGGKSDFEEETFLDMFIYQAGSKNNKPIYSLEDFRQTSIFSKLSRIPDIEKKELSAWYKELTEDKRYFEILQDSYRSQDLDLMDSLQKEISSDNHLKYMLYDRNVIMADNIDSIIQSNTSLFIGIGAAHLPKAKGVIGLLRSKGYSVESVTPTISDKAKKMKEELSSKKRALPFSNSFSTKLFSMKVSGKIYETPSYSYQRQFFAPELTNGTFYTVTQMSTYAFLQGTSKANYLDKIDSLLFENIPGEIVEKKEITKNGFKGLDILNKTKSGDYQHYQIIVTPINVFVFKMGGKDNFVKDKGDKFFEAIKLDELSTGWEEVSTIKNDFSVSLPSYHHIKNNTKITSLYGHPEIEGYDKKDNSYYLVKRASLHDNSFIEEDEFELKRIIDKFCKELDIDSVYSKEVIKNTKYPTAIGNVKTSENKNLFIKVIIKGAYYYVLASVTDNEKPNAKFFNSFKLHSFKYSFDFEERIDSTLNFTVKSNYLSPSPYKQMVDAAYDKRRNKNNKEDKAYLRKRESESYYSENFEKINVEYVKYHRYKQYTNIDTLWNKVINYFKDDKLVLKSRETAKEGSVEILNAVFVDTNSNRSIVKKYFLNKGIIHILTSNLDTTSEQSDYVANFFTTFKPRVKNNNISVLDDKPTMFFNAIHGTDSLEKERALKSVSDYVVFTDKDVDNLIDVITNYDFPSKHIEAKAQLISDLGKLNSPKILPFLTNLYDDVEETALFQVSILKALAKQKNKKASKTLLKLLDKDIPLSGSSWATKSMFRPYRDSLELAKELFPVVLNYTFVDDYKDPIYNVLVKAIDSNEIKSKKYKKYYQQILREAKIELKTQISYEQTEEAKEEEQSYYYSSFKNKGNNSLVKYATMLIPFYKKKDVQQFFVKLKRVKDYEVQTDIAVKLIAHKIPVEENLWNYLAEDIVNKKYLYRKLKRINRLDLFPIQHKTQELMSKSLLYSSGFNFKKDSIELIEKRSVVTLKGEGYVYFFKTKKEKDDKWKIDYIGLQPSDEKEVSLDGSFEEKGIKIQKGKEISEILDEQIKQIEIEGHKRATEEVKGGYSYY